MGEDPRHRDVREEIRELLEDVAAGVTVLCLRPSRLGADRHESLDRVADLDRQMHEDHGNPVAGVLLAVGPYGDGDVDDERLLGKAAVGEQPRPQGVAARCEHDVVDRGTERTLDGLEVVEGNVGEGYRSVRRQRTVEGSRWGFEEACGAAPIAGVYEGSLTDPRGDLADRPDRVERPRRERTRGVGSEPRE
jgi:hypothetical protein